MTTLEVLTRARELIDSPEKWGRGQYLDDASDPWRRCLVGALREAAGGWTELLSPLAVVARALGRASLVEYNDAAGTTHADIMALLDRAIERERQSG